MLDFPATAVALWDLFDLTGIRPEYAIVCMAEEAGLNPAAVNPGSGCTGLNQLCAGIPAGYASWPASAQIREVVTPYWRNLVEKYGAIRSGARLEQGNMYPASLAYARWPWSVIVSQTKDRGAYEGNASQFDPLRTGAIRVQGIANRLGRIVGSAMVQDAIAKTYEARTYEVPLDPVYGADFLYEGRWSTAISYAADRLAEVVASAKARVGG